MNISCFATSPFLSLRPPPHPSLSSPFLSPSFNPIFPTKTRNRSALPPNYNQYTSPRASATDSNILTTPLTLNLTDSTTLKLRFNTSAMTTLKDQVNTLIHAFQKLQEATDEGRQRRQKEKTFEYRYEDEKEGLRVSMECNPNLFTTAFQAKVYVSVDDGTVAVSGEIMLTKLVDNVKAYKVITTQAL